jgi:integrase
MARELERLTAAQVRRAKPGWHHDGGGLYLRVNGDGAYWFFRYGAGGKRYHAIGPAHTVKLADARSRAAAARMLLIDGRDPKIERAQIRAAAQVEAAKRVTVTEAIDAFHANHRPKWRSRKHAKEWRTTLATFVEPTLGRLPVGAIDTTLVLKCIEPVWQMKTITASRVRQRLESVLDFAKVRGWRDDDNPARWKGHLDHLLPKPREIAPVQHYTALPYADVPDFVAKLRKADGVVARCLEFLILTAARNAEARSARWSQIEGDVWKCPPEIMKRNREHLVPLSAAAQAILKRMRGKDATFVFPGRDGAIGDTAFNDLMAELGVADEATVHGFRSSFRDWIGEETEFARELAEMALSHKVGDDTETSYRRGAALMRRRKLMDAWARYCDGGTKVLKFNKQA